MKGKVGVVFLVLLLGAPVRAADVAALEKQVASLKERLHKALAENMKLRKEVRELKKQVAELQKKMPAEPAPKEETTAEPDKPASTPSKGPVLDEKGLLALVAKRDAIWRADVTGAKKERMMEVFWESLKGRSFRVKGVLRDVSGRRAPYSVEVVWESKDLIKDGKYKGSVKSQIHIWGRTANEKAVDLRPKQVVVISGKFSDKGVSRQRLSLRSDKGGYTRVRINRVDCQLEF